MDDTYNANCVERHKCKVIQVHTRERLLSLDATYGLADRLNELDIPRREVIEWGTNVLYRWIGDGGVILSGEGKVIHVYPGIFDDAHGEDGSGTWVSQQRRRRTNPPQRRPRKSILLRLQLYDAIFRIATGRSILGEEAVVQTMEGE